MRTYRDILAFAEFRALFLVRSASLAAISIGSLALGTTTYASTGSTVLTALAMFGGPLITLVGSATVLGASDSMGPRRAAMIMPVAYAVAFLLQAQPGLVWWWRFAILAIPYLAGSATSGSTMRLLHEIVPPDGFVLGRATLNIAIGVTQVAGFALGGLLLVWFSPATLFLIAASLSVTAAVALRVGIRERQEVRFSQGLVRRTRTVNRDLLTSPVVRPLYLATWVPSGLVVGCEALFVPYAKNAGAGYLFASAATGMLLGDVLVGRFVSPHRRDGMIEPLRLLLALPYLGFLFSPPLPVALALAFLASVGYSASLPLQERLVNATTSTRRGQAFGLYSTGLMVGQALGAALGGVLAAGLGPAYAMGAMSVASVCLTLALRPGLRRSESASQSRDVSTSEEKMDARDDSPALDLLELTEERHEIAERFWQLFLHDLSEFRDSVPDERGAFKRRHLEPFLAPDEDRAGYVVYGQPGPIGFAFVSGLAGAVRRFDQFFIVRSQRRARLGRAAAEATVRLHPGHWEVGFQNENPVAARFWRRLAAEIGTDVAERLQPVPNKPHIPADVILSFRVALTPA